jgi:hypothetical protein
MAGQGGRAALTVELRRVAGRFGDEATKGEHEEPTHSEDYCPGCAWVDLLSKAKRAYRSAVAGQFPTFLLDDEPVSGTLAVSRSVGPPRHAVLVGDTFAAVEEAVSTRCENWGGGSHLLLPGRAFDAEVPNPWRDLAESSDPNFYETIQCSPGFIPEARWSEGRAVPSLVILAALGRAPDELRSVEVPVLDEADPWRLAYLTTIGTLPEAPDPKRLELTRLRRDIRYDEVVRVDRQEVVGSGADLLQRIRAAPGVSPVKFSRTFLSSESTEIGVRDQIRELFGIPRIGLERTVIVYSPDNVDDACLVWCLRAASGWSEGGPLAVPVTADVPGTIKAWSGQSAFLTGSMMIRRYALVSASVEQSELASLAAELGDEWSCTSVEDILRPWLPPARRSQDVVAMDRGRAEVATWSPEDIRELGRHLSVFPGLGMVARLRPSRVVLPPGYALSTPHIFSNGDFHIGGYATDVGDPGTTAEMAWPTGWTVLRSFARDRGREVRVSPPGQACEALVRRIGGIDQLWLLDGPEVAKVLYRLSERSGMSWFKDRMRRLTESVREVEDSEATAEAKDQLTRIEVLLGEIVASPDDSDRRGAPLDAFNGIGRQESLNAWMGLAEERGILLRGTEIECGLCDAKAWRPISDLSDEMLCLGCGDRIPRPYRPDMLQFHYRISEMLLRVLEHDALGHLLTLRWFTRLFYSGMRGTERLIGGHPGVSFLRDGRELGEADVFLMFADGSCAVGEYKRSGNGLNDNELAKLERLAEAVDADWTFTATHDFARDCPDLWRKCQREPPGRPHFSITGDHLYRSRPWILGENPFAYPDDSDPWSSAPISDPASQAKQFDQLHHPDAALFDAWEYNDRRDADKVD